MVCVYSDAMNRLSGSGIESVRMEAELLLAHVLGVPREAVMFDPPQLTDVQQAAYEALIGRREAREPMSHLLGQREFYGREFRVTKDVLDPRPDTETLINAVLEIRDSRLAGVSSNPDSHVCILDIGTGSGCIIITLLKEIEGATGVGLDVSAEALKVAFANKMHHSLENQLDLVHGSMMDISNKNSALADTRFDVIVSNPPYIPTKDMAALMPEVRCYEPQLALDGGKDGLDCYREIAKSTHRLLKPDAFYGKGGLIFLEIGAGQANDVADIFRAEQWQLISVNADLAGHERCVVFQYKTN